MNSSKKILKSAETTIKAASIIRLLVDALTALLLVYSCTKNILLQVHEFGVFYLLLIVFILFVDMIFAVLWQFSKNLADFHGVCYMIFGLIFYGIYFGLVYADAQTVERLNFDALNVKLPIVHVWGYYLIGLIPFFVYKIGKAKIKKSNRVRIRELMELGIKR